MNYITYCRVSTDKQGLTGLGMDAQRDAVELHARRTQGTILAAYIEVESGKNNSRPALADAINHCRRSGAILLIAKLDRLARNVMFVASLMESGIEFVAADMPTANRLTIHILAAVAEHEARATSQRTKDALAAAKARGIKLGGYRGGKTTLSKDVIKLGATKRTALASQRNEQYKHSIALARTIPNMSLQRIANFLNVNGIVAPRGGKWTPMQVKRVEDACTSK